MGKSMVSGEDFPQQNQSIDPPLISSSSIGEEKTRFAMAPRCAVVSALLLPLLAAAGQVGGTQIYGQVHHCKGENGVYICYITIYIYDVTYIYSIVIYIYIHMSYMYIHTHIYIYIYMYVYVSIPFSDKPIWDQNWTYLKRWYSRGFRSNGSGDSGTGPARSMEWRAEKHETWGHCHMDLCNHEVNPQMGAKIYPLAI